MAGLVVMGVDPGLASMGVVVLGQVSPGDPIQTLHATVVRTSKLATKQKRDLRVSADDQRRFIELYRGLEAGLLHHPVAVCVEVFSAYKGAGKTGSIYGGVCFWAHARGLSVLPAVPQDVKRGICGKVSASKTDVQARIVRLVPTLKEPLASLPRGQHEHVVDAGAHAYLGLQEIWEMRQMAGTVLGEV